MFLPGNAALYHVCLVHCQKRLQHVSDSNMRLYREREPRRHYTVEMYRVVQKIGTSFVRLNFTEY